MSGQSVTLTAGDVALPASGHLASGFYQIPAEQYHADPAPEPSLSRGLALEILEKTPKHGWLAHPRLGGRRTEKRSRKLDVGSIAHALMTGEGRDIVVIDEDSYRKKAAQEARDAALERDELPALRPDLVRAEKIVASARQVLTDTPRCAGAFDASTRGGGEVTAIWRDPIGIYGRAMIDWVGPEPTDLWDFKTTGCGRLSDRELDNRIHDGGLDMQAAWYSRGVAILRPELVGRIRFRFLFVEDDEPFEARVVALDGDQMELGRRRVLTAALHFERGMREGAWPGYPREIGSVVSPPWHAGRWTEREMSDPFIQMLDPKRLMMALSSQAPMRVADQTEMEIA